jgi:Topoisomerase DNA binding C4 zinc finger
MDMQDTVARLKQGIATMADEIKLQDLIFCSLQELRAQYRRSSDCFSPDLIAELQRAARLAEAIHEFRDAVDDASDARTRDEAMDLASQLESLRTRLWPPVLARRLDKELRELAERAVSLPEAQTLKRGAVRRRIVMELESAAPPCTRCGRRVVLRETADGAFWGCSAFPRCFSSRPLKRDEWKSLEGVL